MFNKKNALPMRFRGDVDVLVGAIWENNGLVVDSPTRCIVQGAPSTRKRTDTDTTVDRKKRCTSLVTLGHSGQDNLLVFSIGHSALMMWCLL